MTLQSTNFSSLRVDRNHLKDQVTVLLREQIISGQIRPGTRLVEQELADLLGISRMPVRDGLMELEQEGLIISKPHGRYVIELAEEDIRQLFEVRLSLEKLAVDLAAQHVSAEAAANLKMNLQKMSEAIERGDRSTYVKSDLEAHELIWQLAQNRYLYNMLHSIAGPIFMFISNHPSLQTDWHETFQLHRELILAICAGNSAAAVSSIEKHLALSLHFSLQVFVRLKSNRNSE